MKTFLILSFILLANITKLSANSIEDFNKHFRLLPLPQKVELLAGDGLMYSGLSGVHLKNADHKPVMEGYTAGLPLVETATAGTVSLVINPGLSLPSAEGYTLKISNKQVVIEAISQAGLFYGIQTLNQLLEDSHDQQIEIPACLITDYPEIAYRAIHLDLKHHLNTGNYFYSIIDRLAKIKINAIIIEFEDKLRYRRAPAVGAANAISIEEFAAISKYAKERNIEISPLVQGLGHASFILKHDEYKALRDDPASDWVFDPMNPETYKLQFALYEDAMAATPNGKYLHVGGDEVGKLGKSELSKKSGKTPFELQMYWLTKVTQFATEHNRIPIFWDDMLFNYSGLYETTYNPEMSAAKATELWKNNRAILDKNIALFPKNCIYMRWNYDYPKLTGNQLAIDWFNENKLTVMAATAAQCGWLILPENNSNFQSIKDFCELTSVKKMSGILCTVWDDCSPHFETVWRGLYDFALLSWNYEDIPVQAAHAAFRHRFYSPALESEYYNTQDLLETGIPFWSGSLIKKGKGNYFEEALNLIDLPDKDKSKAWTTQYKEKLAIAENAVSQYETVKTRLAEMMALSRRNQYALEVFNQINELEVYPSKLLLLLQKYDNSTLQGKKEIAFEIKKYVEGFAQMRSNLESVYSETRMMSNPPGYILDMNYAHHRANTSNNSDWMFVAELAMHAKILDWISN